MSCFGHEPPPPPGIYRARQLCLDMTLPADRADMDALVLYGQLRSLRAVGRELQLSHSTVSAMVRRACCRLRGGIFVHG